MSPDSNSGRPILSTIRAELGVLEVRISKLRELERLAMELDGGPPAAPERPARPRGSSARRKSGQLEVEILALLKDGPRTSPEIRTLLNVGQASTDACLRRLFGIGKVQHDTGIPRTWSLMPNVAVKNGDRAHHRDSDDSNGEYLEQRLVALLKRGPQTIAQAAQTIDAPERAVESACERLVGAGTVSKMTDGTWVA